MTELIDTLHTLCQVGVAFLGFGGMATAIGSRGTQRHRHAFANLNGSLLAGFVLAVGSALPLMFHHFGLESATALRSAAGVLLATNAAITYYALRWSPTEQPDAFAKFFFLPAELAINGCLLVVVFGGLAGAAPGIYLLVLVLALLEGGVGFLTFFHDAFTTENPAQDS